LDLIDNNPGISKSAMSQEIGISGTAIDKNIGKLRRIGLLTRLGSAFTGKWIIQ
jgi:biotin operon repressor